MAYGKDDNGHPLPWKIIRSRVDSRLEDICNAVEADTWKGYLTGQGNFRIAEATIRPYKGNRNQPKPFHYWNIREYLSTRPEVEMSNGCEADDLLGIEQYKNNIGEVVTCICSRDKDLAMIPGWHYSWESGSQKEKPLREISETEGLLWFFTQLLVGDATDNIPGLYGMGYIKAQNILRHTNDPVVMYFKCKDYYQRYFGSYWEMFLYENARLLWIWRKDGDNVVEYLKELDANIVHLKEERTTDDQRSIESEGLSTP